MLDAGRRATDLGARRHRSRGRAARGRRRHRRATALARADVFDAPATAVYLPPGRVDRDRGERAHRARARRDRRRRAARTGRCATPMIVDAERRRRARPRASPAGSAQVHDVIADTVPAQRLLVGETFNAAGQWSSFPPHKHDGGDGEPALEEVYYYRFDRPDGFGFQGLYEHGRIATERAVFLRHGAVVGIPRGYHPVCAAPGYRLYYLWALEPERRTPRVRSRCTKIPRIAGCTNTAPAEARSGCLPGPSSPPVASRSCAHRLRHLGLFVALMLVAGACGGSSARRRARPKSATSHDRRRRRRTPRTSRRSRR